ncbi:MAG: hypothetical protein ACRD0E_08355 [Acidimicrobiales bacterium]
MGVGRRAASVGLLVGLVVLATPSVAAATVSISVPTTANLGSAPTGGGTLSAQLGAVTVSATGVLGLLLPSFTATVSSTSFATGGGSTAETIPAASIFYWSGPATATAGLQTPVPGQLTANLAQSLSSSPVTAFKSSGTVLSITTTWDPTIVVHIPAAVVAGTYVGTITQSAA